MRINHQKLKHSTCPCGSPQLRVILPSFRRGAQNDGVGLKVGVLSFARRPKHDQRKCQRPLHVGRHCIVAGLSSLLYSYTDRPVTDVVHRSTTSTGTDTSKNVESILTIGTWNVEKSWQKIMALGSALSPQCCRATFLSCATDNLSTSCQHHNITTSQHNHHLSTTPILKPDQPETACINGSNTHIPPPRSGPQAL